MPATLSKEAAGYLDRSPMVSERCGNCSMFLVKAHACTLVKGVIEMQAWCRYWQKYKARSKSS